MAQSQKRTGRSGEELSHHGIVTLPELGLTLNDSQRWCLLVEEFPGEDFELYVADVLAKQELTTSAAVASAKGIRRQRELEAQLAEIAITARTVTDLYHVIVIDPPWPYGTKYNPEGRRVANPYPEESLESLASREIPCHPDCILWLWTTHKFLRHSFALIDTWGFRDVAILAWDKEKMGIGQWLRSQTEYCVMAVKGKPLVTLTNQVTIIRAPAREHSRKPDEFYSMVESLCPGRRADAFSRQVRKDWDQIWAPEAEKF